MPNDTNNTKVIQDNKGGTKGGDNMCCKKHDKCEPCECKCKPFCYEFCKMIPFRCKVFCEPMEMRKGLCSPFCGHKKPYGVMGGYNSGYTFDSMDYTQDDSFEY